MLVNVFPLVNLYSQNLMSVPGWNDYVKSYRTDAMFWHVLWKDNGCPKTGYIADMRRRTRYQYHNVLRKVKYHEQLIKAIKMADNIDSYFQSIS